MPVLQKNAYHCDTFPGFSVTDGTLPKGKMWKMSVSFCIFGCWGMKIGEGITFKWISTMETGHRDRKWIIIRIDGKIAAVSTDYRMLARISEHLTLQAVRKPGQSTLYGEISATAADFDEVWKLRQEVGWDDLMLFGTDFQKKVWKKLWELTHKSEPHGETTDQVRNDGERSRDDETRLISYTDFAELCQNRAGVRAVAHALGLNPISVIIPCHLVIPKEGIDKIREIHNRAQSTIFKGDDLCIGSILADTSIDFGEYTLGKSLKRELIIRELTENSI